MSSITCRMPEKPRMLRWKMAGRGCAALMAAILLGLLLNLPFVNLMGPTETEEIYRIHSSLAHNVTLTIWGKQFSNPHVLLPSVLSTQLGLFVVAGWHIRRALRKGNKLHLHEGPLMAAILTGLGGVMLLLAVAILNGYFVHLVLGRSPPKSWKAVQQFVFWARVSIFLLAVVVSPIVEEFFFRGYLFASFKREGHIYFGMVTSAFLFAVMHFHNPYYMGAFFGFGLVLAWLYHRTGSLLSSITAHAANNGLVLLWLLAGKY